MRRKGAVTAEELLEELNRDPAFRARQEDLERQENLNRRQFALHSAPIAKDLQTIGVALHH